MFKSLKIKIKKNEFFFVFKHSVVLCFLFSCAVRFCFMLHLKLCVNIRITKTDTWYTESEDCSVIINHVSCNWFCPLIFAIIYMLPYVLSMPFGFPEKKGERRLCEIMIKRESDAVILLWITFLLPHASLVLVFHNL